MKTMEKKDAIVVGCGGSGSAAALTLAKGGAKVVVFEKMAAPGGSTNFVEGIYAADSEMQRRRNIKASRDEGFRQLMEYSHWKANSALVRAIVDKSAGTISWLQQEGVEFAEPSADWLGGPRVWHLLKGFGDTLVKVLVENAIKNGVEIHYETRARQLQRNGEGKVTGVIVEDNNGNRTKVDGKVVIIASGGYANNAEWIKKYICYDLGVNIFPLGDYDKRGDGIEMAWSVGAAEEGTNVVIWSIGAPPDVGLLSHMLGAVGQPTLWINQNGVRFCDETVIENMIHTGNIMSRQPGGYCYRIFDADTVAYWAEYGGIGVGMYLPPTTRFTNLEAEFKTAVEENNPYRFVAESLDELADKMGVDRATFRRTVENYNGYCEKGHDDEFGKDPLYLRPVRTPKLYAVKCYIDFIATVGGIRINEKTEVLDKNNRMIPGLYAVGCDAGGMYGDSYDIYASGIGSSFAINSGRLAGENALKFMGM